MTDHSQFGEYSQGIAPYFDDVRPPANRFLVDVGTHGKKNSNTFNLIEGGWSGLWVEPEPKAVAWCRKDLKPHLDRVRVIEAAVVTDEMEQASGGKARLYLHKRYGQHSLRDDQHPESRTRKSIEVDCISLGRLCRDQGVPTDFDLLDLDIEGLDNEVLVSFLAHWDFRPGMIVIESPDERTRGALRDAGYGLYWRNDVNEVHVRA
jgi:FkbM family methyltransferase